LREGEGACIPRRSVGLEEELQQEGLAHIPRSIATFNIVHTTTIKEAVQQREGTEIKVVILQQVGTISHTHLQSFCFCSVQFLLARFSMQIGDCL
jgi:hypothetical protein